MPDTFAAWWPIHDDDRTMTELIAEAAPELSAMVSEAGHVIAGQIQWSTAERVEVGLVLVAVAPVAPAVDDAETEEPSTAVGRLRTHADTVEDVEWLLEADPALLPQNVADRLGVTWEAVRRALSRAGRTDLSDRITLNNELRNWHLTGRRSA